jgi:NTE family protein
MAKVALFLGGGAPNLTLMSGALLALHEGWVKEEIGETFDFVSMGGAGAVVGLLYLAPKGMTSEDALKNTVNMAVSDQIYSMFPVNYKVFTKSGPSADLFYEMWFSLPIVQAAMNQYGMSDEEKLEADWLLLLGALLCPTDANYFSEGLCAHARFLDDIIDFSKVPALQEQIFISALKLGDKAAPRQFDKTEITAAHVQAALSFPFLYPPREIDGEYYYEGAAFQSLAAGSVPVKELDWCVVLDVLQPDLIRRPRDLWDAYGLSIIMPVAGNAEYGRTILFNQLLGITLKQVSQKVDTARRYLTSLALTEQPVRLDRLEHYFGLITERLDEALRLASRNIYDPQDKFSLYGEPRTTRFRSERNSPKYSEEKWISVDFEIPPERRPYALDWSRSNMEALFDIGYRAGMKAVEKLKKAPRKRWSQEMTSKA